MASQQNPKLGSYRAKRDPTRTPEPFGRIHIPATGQLFVVQQHAASHLHFDLRLEVDGVLKSWAVPKGPSDAPSDKRLAMETEDHPLDYADFEGVIPPDNYGAGHVIVWDRGRYSAKDDFKQGFIKGKLLFDLHGYKLKGRWTLVRLKSKTSTGREWLFIKEHDNYISDAGPTYDHSSVLSGLTLEELKREKLKKTKPTRTALHRAANKLSNSRPLGADRIELKPMLASPGQASDQRGWLWELKYDGYRIMASKDDHQVTLSTRNGLNISNRFPEICQVIAHLPISSCLLDGEIVVNDHSGRPNFSAMQQRARATNPNLVARQAIEQPATYYCFDLLQIEGIDLRDTKLTERKQLLAKVLPAHSALIYSEHVENAGRKTFAAAQALGIEGVVGKRANASYRAGRSGDWIKVRNQRSAEFVVLGWSPSKGNGADIGSLAVGEYRSGELCYAGHAGSGLGQVMRSELQKRMRPLGRKTSPVSKRSLNDLPKGKLSIG